MVRSIRELFFENRSKKSRHGRSRICAKIRGISQSGVPIGISLFARRLYSLVSGYALAQSSGDKKAANEWLKAVTTYKEKFIGRKGA